MADRAVMGLFDSIMLAADEGTLDDPNREPTKVTIMPVSRTAGIDPLGPLFDQKVMTIGAPEASSLPTAIAKAVDQVTQQVSILTGQQGPGSLLDKAITTRDLLQGGLLTINAGALRLGNGTGLILGGDGIPSFGGTLPTTPGEFIGLPHLLVPPTPTNLRASGTFHAVILTWDLLDYENHGFTEVWRSATNNLGAAVLIGTAVGKIYVDTAGVALGVTYYYWVRDVTNDPVPVTGSFNAGVGGGTAGGAGLIGNVDLGPLIVEADNIALKAVDSTKMTMSDFSTIADNPTFEAGDVGWTTHAGFQIVNEPANAFNGSWCAKTTNTVDALRNNIFIPTIVGDEFYAEAMVKTAPGTTGLGGRVRLTGYNAAGLEVVNYGPSLINSNTYAVSSIAITVPAGIAAIRVEIEVGITAGTLYADNVRFQRKLTLNHLAAGSIAVGSAAIANGAIRNALIENLAVDDAKIASLDAAKITTGFLSADRIQANSLSAIKLISGSITALQIAAFAITANEIASNAITSAKIAAGAIVAGKIAAGAITATEIAAGTITTDRIFVGAVSAPFQASYNGVVTAIGSGAAGISAVNIPLTTVFVRNGGRIIMSLAYDFIFTINSASTANRVEMIVELSVNGFSYNSFRYQVPVNIDTASGRKWAVWNVGQSMLDGGNDTGLFNAPGANNDIRVFLYATAYLNSTSVAVGASASYQFRAGFKTTEIKV